MTKVRFVLLIASVIAVLVCAFAPEPARETSATVLYLLFLAGGIAAGFQREP